MAVAFAADYPALERAALAALRRAVERHARVVFASEGKALRAYPDGVLVEEYVDGIDVTVGFIEGVGHDDGVLTPVELLLESTADRPFNIYDYRLKHVDGANGKSLFRCPAGIPRDIAARLRAVSAEAVRTLSLRDVGEDIGMHESTISRVTTNKYVETPQGLFELKFFFHSGIASGDGEMVSSVSVKKMIQDLLAAEDPAKPQSDQEVAQALQKRGLTIARRTVAKYREELGILPSHQRRLAPRKR